MAEMSRTEWILRYGLGEVSTLPPELSRIEELLVLLIMQGGSGGGGGSGTTNYNLLDNKPSVNGIELRGNKTSAQLGINIVTNYDNLTSRPQINGVTLTGDKSTSQLGLDDYRNMTNKPSINSVPLVGNKTLADLGFVHPTIDSAISTVSTNAVQNRVIKQALDTKLVEADVADLRVEVSDNSDAIDVLNGTGDGSVQKQIQTAIANISVLSKEIVSVLPSVQDAEDNIIYLLPTESSGIYEQYTLVTTAGGVKEIALLGSTETDLSGYYTKNQADSLLDDKVDKETGKGLSAEDFTTALKEKLDDIETEANKTVVDDILSNLSVNPVKNYVIYEALKDKQDALTFDTEPTVGSDNPVTSSGIATALANVTVNTATVNDLGIVKPDGSSITVDEDGTLHGSAGVSSGNLVDISEEREANARIFLGTKAQWNALTLTNKSKYDLVNIIDDDESAGAEIVDSVTSGVMNPVTSNAVYDAIHNQNAFYDTGNNSGMNFETVINHLNTTSRTFKFEFLAKNDECYLTGYVTRATTSSTPIARYIGTTDYFIATNSSGTVACFHKAASGDTNIEGRFQCKPLSSP